MSYQSIFANQSDDQIYTQQTGGYQSIFGPPRSVQPPKPKSIPKTPAPTLPTNWRPTIAATAPQPSAYHGLGGLLHHAVDDVGGAAHSLYQSVQQPVSTLYHAGVVNPIKLGAAEVTHNTAALNNVGKSIQQNSIHKILGAGIQTASLALPGVGGAAEKLAAKVAPKLLGKVASTTAQKGIVGSLTRAGLGGANAAPAFGAFTAGQTAAQGGSPKQIIKSGVQGLGLGFATGGAGSLIKSGVGALRAAPRATPLPSPLETPKLTPTPVETQPLAGQGSASNNLINHEISEEGGHPSTMPGVNNRVGNSASAPVYENPPTISTTEPQLRPQQLSPAVSSPSLMDNVAANPTIVKTDATGIQALADTGRLPTKLISNKGDHSITLNQDLSAYKDHVPASEIFGISKGVDVPTPSLVGKLTTPKNEAGFLRIGKEGPKATPAPETTPSISSTGSVSLDDVLAKAKASEKANADKNTIIDALSGKTGAIATRAKQEAAYSAERSARLAQSQAQGAELPGLAGYHSELGAFKGELPKQPYPGMGDHLTPAQQDSLFTNLRQQVKANPNIKGYSDLNTQTALRKVIYGDSGVPTAGEIKLLQKAFGGDFADAVTKSIKSTIGDKLFAIWRAGLLTGPKTVAKILTSHTVQLPAEGAAQIIAAPLDKVISMFTGQRSKILSLRGQVEGAKGFGEGVKSGLKFVKTGVDNSMGNTEDFTGDKTFGPGPVGRTLEFLTQLPGRVHGSIYQPFAGYGAHAALYNEAKTAAMNQGLKGTEREAAIARAVENPTPQMLKTAREAGQYYSFQQETALNKAVSGAENALKNSKMPGANLLLKVIIPFKRIPSAIATGAMNFSPAGGINSIVKAVRAAKSTEGLTVDAQRQLVEGLGRSIVGTAAVVPGAILYNKGIMTLNYPTDSNEQQLWAAEGKQPDSVLIDGKWRSLGSLGPLGIVLTMGGHFARGLSQGQSLPQAFLTGYGGGLKAIESQSYVQGIAGIVTSLQDPGRYLPNVEKSYAGSLVPTGLAQVASATDKNARQANTPLETIKNRIPGLRQGLPIKTDPLGNPVPNDTGIGAILDPFYSKSASPPNPVITELQRLQDSGAGIGQPKITSAESFNSIKYNLTKPQVQELNKNVGQLLQPLWRQTVTDPNYANLSDSEKQTVLDNIHSDATATAKDAYAQAHNLGQYDSTYSGNPSNLTANQQSIQSGDFDPTVYFDNTQTRSANKPTVQGQSFIHKLFSSQKPQGLQVH